MSDDRQFEEHDERPRRAPDPSRLPTDREVPLSLSEEPMPDGLDAWLGAALVQRRRERAPAGLAARIMASLR